MLSDQKAVQLLEELRNGHLYRADKPRYSLHKMSHKDINAEAGRRAPQHLSPNGKRVMAVIFLEAGVPLREIHSDYRCADTVTRDILAYLVKEMAQRSTPAATAKASSGRRESPFDLRFSHGQ